MAPKSTDSSDSLCIKLPGNKLSVCLPISVSESLTKSNKNTTPKQDGGDQDTHGNEDILKARSGNPRRESKGERGRAYVAGKCYGKHSIANNLEVSYMVSIKK